MSFPLRRTAVTTAAGCMALAMASPAIAASATTVAHPAKPAAKAQKVFGGKTSLAIDGTNLGAYTTAGFTVAPTGKAKLALPNVTFPVTGGTVNVAKLTGTVDQAGGLSISKAGTTIVINNAKANLAKRVATATVTGKSSGFVALKLGKPTSKKDSAKKATITGYTVSLSKAAIAYLDKKFATTIFKSHAELGTATTTLTFKK